MKGLVDADILVFRAGFAAERNQWFLAIKGEEPTVYALKKEALAALDEALPGIHSRVEGEDYQLWSERYLEPVENALHNVNTVMGRIMEDCMLTEFDVKCYLSGGTNFRYDVAKTKPYKGNRDQSHRPVHEEAIRNHIKGKWETVVTDGIEADDALGIEQCTSDEETCIISIDKDLDMIPGLHYNFMHEVHYAVTEEEAWRIFCKQLLTGDSTDNIPGLPKVGAVKAEKMLDGVSHDDMLEEVARQYASKSGKEDWFDYMLEQATLLWIQQAPEQLPPLDMNLQDLGGTDDGTIETSLFH